MNKKEVYKGFHGQVNFRKTVIKKFYTSCAEKAVTYCLNEDGCDAEDEFGIEAKSEQDAIKLLYAQGWRNIQYTGHMSYACPHCLEYIKDHQTDEYGWTELEIEEIG